MKRNHKSMAGAALTAGLTALALAGCTVGPVTLPDINIDLGFLKGIGIVTTSVADAEAAIRDVRECGVDPSELVEQGTLTVGLLPSNSAPLNATKQDGSRAGIDVEVAYAMADHVGLPVKFVTVSSAATSLGVDCDVVMGVPTSDAASSDDMYAAIDEAAEKATRQLRKYKTRVIDRRQRATVAHAAPVSAEDLAALIEPAPDQDEDDQLVREKVIDLVPMTEEEALVQTDLIGHDFYVFTNATTGLINVIYHRKNGGYGIIKPKIEENEE